MTDIVEDLKAPYWDDGSPHALMVRAAKEIKRNRADIAELVAALNMFLVEKPIDELLDYARQCEANAENVARKYETSTEKEQ